MSILLNEYEWTEKMIADGCLGDKPGETLSRMARYYYQQNYSKKDIRNMLEIFLMKNNGGVLSPSWDKTLERCVRNSSKYPLSRIDGINISKPEIDRIEALEGTQLRRLAFTLLCLAKYYDDLGDSGDHWVHTEDSDIMRMANINTSIRRQSLLYGRLNEEGLIQFSRKVDSLSVKVLFVEDGDTVLTIHDLRDLGYRYLMYRGEPYFECANCGVVTKITEPKKGRRQKYCSSCAIEVKTRQSVNSVMRQRHGLMN